MIKKHVKTEKNVMLPAKVVGAPLFPPTPQTTPYSVAFGNIVWTTGSDDHLETLRGSDLPPPVRRGFDIRHFDLLAVIADACWPLTVQRAITRQNTPLKWQVSLSELARRMGKEDGTKQLDYVGKLLADLYHINMSITQDDDTIVFRAISALGYKKYRTGLALEYIVINDVFVEFLTTIRQIVMFRLDQKVKMPSLVAQSIYTYIPSRAIHRSASRPFEINLMALLKELRLPIPSAKTRRKRVFTQNKKSIMSQLDGAELANGLTLRVAIRDCKDGKDYKFCAWVEKTAARIGAAPDGRLLDWWIAADRNESDFYAAVSARKELAPYIAHALASCGIDVNGSRVFLEMASSLLAVAGADFEELAGTMKQLALEGRIRAPFPYLCTMIRNAFKTEGAQLELL